MVVIAPNHTNAPPHCMHEGKCRDMWRTELEYACARGACIVRVLCTQLLHACVNAWALSSMNDTLI